MPGIIIDIASRCSEGFKTLSKYPQSVLIEIWYDYQYEDWTKRGQKADKKQETSKDEYKRIMSVWS